MAEQNETPIVDVSELGADHECGPSLRTTIVQVATGIVGGAVVGATLAGPPGVIVGAALGGMTGAGVALRP